MEFYWHELESSLQKKENMCLPTIRDFVPKMEKHILMGGFMPKNCRYSVTNGSTLYCTKGEIFAANWQFSARCWIGGGWQRGLKIFNSVEIRSFLENASFGNAQQLRTRVQEDQEMDGTSICDSVFFSWRKKKKFGERFVSEFLTVIKLRPEKKTCGEGKNFWFKPRLLLQTNCNE